jgi:transposase
MGCGTINGSASRICSRVERGMLAGRRGTIDCSSRRCCIATERAFHGGICRSVLVISAWCIRATRAGVEAASGSAFSSAGEGRRQRICHDRFHHCACASTQRRREKRGPAEQAIGRSRGGLSTKIHATVDALGNPTGFHLTPGQAHDLEGADALLPQTQAATVIADRAYDAQERVITPLETAAKGIVIPSSRSRKQARNYDRHIYQARHLIENFFARLKQYRAIATRYDKTACNFLGAIHLAAAVVWLN